jgi:ABC-type multidrug transport system fused ATPase/permease subunit
MLGINYFSYLYFVFEKNNFDGQIDLNNLGFHYPNRPEVQVLKNFNLKIEPRMKVVHRIKKGLKFLMI